MPRSISLAAVVIALVVQANMAVCAQNNIMPVQPADEADQQQDNGPPLDEQDEVEYYIFEDDDDLWRDEPLSESQWAAEENAPYSGGDPAEYGLRAPPGLPLVGAQPAVGIARRSFGGTRVADKTAPWQAQIYYPKIASEWSARIAAGEQPWILQHYCVCLGSDRSTLH
jgi:hypothetical protein